jgi:hypothetical protein
MEIDFENEGGETYICGNPPYKGRNKKGDNEKNETKDVFSGCPGTYAALDYVANWIFKTSQYCRVTKASAGLVATNSVCQGEQVALLWPLILKHGVVISYAHTSFQWSNLASDKAGVTVVILGLALNGSFDRILFADDGMRSVSSIGPYLVPNSDLIVEKSPRPLATIGRMYLGNMPKDGGNLIMSRDAAETLSKEHHVCRGYLKKFFGSHELIHSRPRTCLWIDDSQLNEATQNPAIMAILDRVARFRSSSTAASTRQHAKTPHRFVQMPAAKGERTIVIPRVSSHNRRYLPVDYLESGPVIGDKCYAMYDEPLWNLALIASSMHLVWIATVCSRLRTDFSYGNKLGWNTFPVPSLTDEDKTALNRSAENILLVREAHWPLTIADLYDPDTMPDDLRAAHDRNDETLERIYIGRRFKNDTERLETLFQLYTELTGKEKGKK